MKRRPGPSIPIPRRPTAPLTCGFASTDVRRGAGRDHDAQGVVGSNPSRPTREPAGQGLTVLTWCGFRGRFWRTAVAELQLSERAVHRPRCCRLMSYPAVASRDLLHAPEWRAGGPERDKRSCGGNWRALTVLAHRRPRPARPARGFSAASTDRRWRCHSRRSRDIARREHGAVASTRRGDLRIGHRQRPARPFAPNRDIRIVHSGRFIERQHTVIEVVTQHRLDHAGQIGLAPPINKPRDAVEPSVLVVSSS